MVIGHRVLVLGLGGDLDGVRGCRLRGRFDGLWGLFFLLGDLGHRFDRARSRGVARGLVSDWGIVARELARDFRGLEVGVDVVGVLELAAGAVAVPLGALRGDDADEGEEHEGPKEGARGTGTHRPCSSSNEEFGGSGGAFFAIFLGTGAVKSKARWFQSSRSR